MIDHGVEVNGVFYCCASCAAKEGHRECGTGVEGKRNGYQLPGFPWTPYSKGRVEFKYGEGTIQVTLLGPRLA
jgi:hypothetical protein